MLGVRRGTVSVVATRFEAAKLIHTARGQIRILDREGLKEEACSCYEYMALRRPPAAEELAFL
jgi:Crp-like helix-turn-helix domain